MPMVELLSGFWMTEFSLCSRIYIEAFTLTLALSSLRGQALEGRGEFRAFLYNNVFGFYDSIDL